MIGYIARTTTAVPLSVIAVAAILATAPRDGEAAEPADHETVTSTAVIAAQTASYVITPPLRGAFVAQVNGKLVAVGGSQADAPPPGASFGGLLSASCVITPMEGESLTVQLPGAEPLGYGAAAPHTYAIAEGEKPIGNALLRFLNKSRTTFVNIFRKVKASERHHQLICVGGLEGRAPTSRVRAVTVDGENTSVEELPSLPVPLLGAGAIAIQDKLYVAGGLTAVAPDQLNTAVYVLDLPGTRQSTRDESAPAGWSVLTELPEAARPGLVRPLLTSRFDDRTDKHVLIVTGGWRPTAEPGTYRPATVSAFFIPGRHTDDGSAPTWTALATPPAKWQLTSALAFGQSFLLFGAVEQTAPGIPLDAIWDVPAGAREILVQDFRTDCWFAVPSEDLVEAPRVIDTGRKTATFLSERTGNVVTMEVQAAKRRFPLTAYIVVVAYIVGMLVLGWIFDLRSKGKGLAEYVLGSRKIHWLVAGLSIYATGISAYSFAGIPGKSYAANWLRFGEPLVAFVGMLIVGYALIPMFRRMGITTMTQYAEMRFGKLIRTISAVTYVLGQLAARMAGVVLLPAMALTAVTGIDIYTCIALVGVLSTIYTVMGGLNAVVWTDVAQVVVLFGGAIAAIVALIASIDGGVGTIVEVSRHYEKMRAFDWSPDLASMTIWVFMLWGVGDMLGRLGQENMQRVFSTDGEKSGRRSMLTCAFISIPGAMIFFLIGTLVFVHFKMHPQKIDPILGAESMFPLFMAQSMHPIVAGLVIAGLFAAAMSTLDSGMHSIATVITTDWFDAFHKDATDKTRLRVAKISTVVIGLLGTGAAMYVASFEVRSVWDYFGRTMGIIGGWLAGQGVLALFTRRAHTLGVFAGGIVNMVIMFGWTMHHVHWLIYGITNMVIAAVLGYIFSLILPKLPSERNKDLTGLTVWTLPPKAERHDG